MCFEEFYIIFQRAQITWSQNGHKEGEGEGELGRQEEERREVGSGREEKSSEMKGGKIERKTMWIWGMRLIRGGTTKCKDSEVKMSLWVQGTLLYGFSQTDCHTLWWVGKQLTSANLAEIKTEICKSTVCLTFMFNSKHLVFSIFHLTALSGMGWSFSRHRRFQNC